MMTTLPEIIAGLKSAEEQLRSYSDDNVLGCELYLDDIVLYIEELESIKCATCKHYEYVPGHGLLSGHWCHNFDYDPATKPENFCQKWEARE
jgi:hypothetical protein